MRRAPLRTGTRRCWAAATASSPGTHPGRCPQVVSAPLAVAEHFPALTADEPDLRQPRRDRWREVPVRYEVDLADALALHRQLHGGERVLGPLVEDLE